MISMKAYATIGDEPYTGFDDVLIPDPTIPSNSNKGQGQPLMIHRETIKFEAVADALVKTPANWGLEIGTKVYFTHEPEDRRTTPKYRAEAWLKLISEMKQSDFKLIEQGTVKLAGVPAVSTEIPLEPYRFTIETNGSGIFGHIQQYLPREQYVQRFYILPISSDEVVTVRSVRNKKNDAPNTQFSTQWEHFLKTLKREVANTRSTTEGTSYRTRRFYTHAFSFEIFKPDEDTGNQWSNDDGGTLVEMWNTQQGEIGVDIDIKNGDYYLNVDKVNKEFKEEAELRIKNTPALAAEFKVEAPKMTYLEKPLGTATAYGYREDAKKDNKERTIDSELIFETVYKTGKKIKINISGSKTAIDANEKMIYKWLAGFKFLP
jgi:hypothetical protein